MKIFSLLFVSFLFSLQTLTAQTISDTSTFNFVDVMPQYKGGEKKMMNFIYKNLRYPEKAREENVQGKAMVQFIIRKDGSIDSIKIIKSVSKECDEEVIRIIKMMPPFSPAMSKGIAVSCYFNLPVTFRLGKDSY